MKIKDNWKMAKQAHKESAENYAEKIERETDKVFNKINAWISMGYFQCTYYYTTIWSDEDVEIIISHLLCRGYIVEKKEQITHSGKKFKWLVIKW